MTKAQKYQLQAMYNDANSTILTKSIPLLYSTRCFQSEALATQPHDEVYTLRFFNRMLGLVNGILDRLSHLMFQILRSFGRRPAHTAMPHEDARALDNTDDSEEAIDGGETAHVSYVSQ